MFCAVPHSPHLSPSLPLQEVLRTSLLCFLPESVCTGRFSGPLHTLPAFSGLLAVDYICFVFLELTLYHHIKSCSF